MPARSQNLKLGLGFKRQTGTGKASTTSAELQTPLPADALWSLGCRTFSIPFPEFTQETDADFYNKGDEFSTQVFPTSIAIPWSFENHLTSQNWAQTICFALGKVVETPAGTGGFQYVATPQAANVEGVNLPATTIVADILGGTPLEILDIAAVGMVCNGFSLKIKGGPGLQNTDLSSQWLGCGKHLNNPGLAIPAATVETRLGAGSTTAITINGVNYIANARFVDLDLNWQNNIIVGYYPGSGSQAGYDIAGRMRMGKRVPGLTWQVELEATSTELADLLAGTEGVTNIKVEGPLIDATIKHTAEAVLHRTRHKAYKMGEVDGFVTAQIVTEIMRHPVNGVMTCTAITTHALIGAEA